MKSLYLISFLFLVLYFTLNYTYYSGIRWFVSSLTILRLTHHLKLSSDWIPFFSKAYFLRQLPLLFFEGCVLRWHSRKRANARHGKCSQTTGWSMWHFWGMDGIKIRKTAFIFHFFKGFHVHRALSGGSGSGYGNEILEHIQDAYSCDVAEFLLMPSLQYSSSNFVQDTYNTVLAIAYSYEHSNSAFVFDNQSLSRVVHETIAPQYSEIEHVNRLYAQYVSAITTPLRLGFDRDLLRSTSDYATLIDSLHCKYQVGV